MPGRTADATRAAAAGRAADATRSAVAPNAVDNIITPPGVPTYYVDNAGSDSNAGTSAVAPWATLAKVNGRTFLPGDQILLKRGGTWNETLTPPSSGTEAQPILFSAYGSGALPIIDAQTARSEAISCGVAISWTKSTFLNLKNGTGVGGLFSCHGLTNIIEDCTAEGHPDSGVAGQADAYIIVRRCLVQNNGDDGLTLHTTSSILAEHCTLIGNRSAINNSGTAIDMIVNDCIFEDNGNGLSSSFGDLESLQAGTHVFNRCTFKGRADGGTFCFYASTAAASNATFNACLFDDSRSGSSAAGSISLNTGTTTVFNNCTFIGNATADRGTLSDSGGTTTLNNCVFYNWWRVQFSGAGVVNADHCLFYSGTTLTLTSNTNPITPADPLFVNAAGRNFHLQAGSPVRGAGVNAGVTTDLDGVAYGTLPSLGAYEYV